MVLYDDRVQTLVCGSVWTMVTMCDPHLKLAGNTNEHGSSLLSPMGTIIEEVKDRRKLRESNRLSRSWRNQRLRERDVIEYGKKEGFLKELSIDEIVASGNSLQEEEIYSIDRVRILNLVKKRITTIGTLSLCRSLVVCNLSNNFLKRINALKHCRNLRKLDVSSNQISVLPESGFWESLPNLAVLHLHSNGIAEYQYIKCLSKCPSLTILTMYDTPVSLKRYYRHCVVNAIWSLKALDNVVVSDEEVIENARFPLKFTTVSPAFKIMVKSQPQETNQSLNDELSGIAKDCATINRVQARLCPVLIIQRTVRGHLTRLRYRYLQEQRTWAAVSIQRFYRYCKGRPCASSTTPSMSFKRDDDVRSISSLKLDYDGYIRALRSKERKRTITAESSQAFSKGELQLHKQESETKSVRGMPHHATPVEKTFNLNKLEAALTQLIEKADHSMPLRSLPDNIAFAKDMKQRKSKSTETTVKDSGLYNPTIITYGHIPQRDKHKLGRYFTQYHFLGEVVITSKDDINKGTASDFDGKVAAESGGKTAGESDGKAAAESGGKAATDPGGKAAAESDGKAAAETDGKAAMSDEFPAQFRLTSRKAPFQKHEPVDELILRTAQGAEDIRQSIRIIEEYLASVPQREATRQPRVTAEQRIFLRNYVTMGLANFHAIERAYKQRDNVEELYAKRKAIRHSRSLNKTTLERGRQYKEHVCAKIVVKNKKEHLRLEKKIWNRSEMAMDCKQAKVRQVQAISQRRKEQEKDSKFVVDFNSQMSSIRKAVLSHQRATQSDELQQQRNTLVENMRDRSYAQKDSIALYFEQRRQVRRAEIALEKANIDAMLASQRLTGASEAQERVRLMKEEGNLNSVVSFTPATAFVPPEPPALGVFSDMHLES